MIGVRLIIAGRVQGLGYRDWLVGEARRLGLRGWVRNLSDGTVETVLAGEAAAVEAGVTACWRGPPMAWVSSVTREDAAVPEAGTFVRLPNERA